MQSLSVSSAALVIAAFAAGCGGGNDTSGQAMTTPPTTTTAPNGTTSEGTTTGPDPLVVEAQQAAAGDIPDNQVFLEFRNAGEGYAMKYPEGWARRGSSGRVTFQDRNNLVRVVIAKGSAATVAGTSARARAAQTADAVAPLRGDRRERR